MTRYILIALALLMISCAKQETPEMIVEKFFTNSDYNLLSSADKQAMTAEEWAEYDYHLPKPILSPSSRYFELERFLYSHFSQVIHPHTVDGDKTLVKVTFKYPTILTELGFFSESAFILFEDEIKQTQANFEKGLITDATLKISDREETYTLLNNGVFMNLADVKEKMKVRSAVSEVKDSLKPLNDLAFTNYMSHHINVDKYDKAIDELRIRGAEQIAADFEAYKSAITKIMALTTDDDAAREARDADSAFRRLVLVKADNYFQNELVISKAVVADSDRRKKALFFDWALKSPSSESLYGASAAFSVTFFDANDRQIGYEEFRSSKISNEEGNLGGSIGLKVEDQAMASKTSRVEVKYLYPVTVSMMKCFIESRLVCGAF